MRSATRQDVAEAAGLSVELINDFFRPSRHTGRRGGLESNERQIAPAVEATHRRFYRHFTEDQLRAIIEALIETGYTHTRGGTLRRKTVLFELPRTWVHDSPMAGAVTSTQIADSTLFGSVTAALSRAVGAEGGRLEIFTNLSDLTWPQGLPEGEEWIQLRRRYSATTATRQLSRVVGERPRSIAGIVIIDPARGDERIQWLGGGDLPYVVMGRPPGAVPDGHVVDIDDESGFEELTRHLRGLGIEASRIGHARFADDMTGPPARRRAGVMRGLGVGAPGRSERRKGVISAAEMMNNSIDIDYHDTDQAAVVEQLRGWLHANDWQAVVADCDRFASYVAKAAYAEGLKLATSPRKGCLVLAGCDDSIERHASTTAWATLRQPVHEWALNVVTSLKRQQRANWNDQQPTLIRPVLVSGRDT